MKRIQNLLKLLWLAPFFSFITGYFLISLFATNKVVKTPALVGKSLDKAFIILSADNLNARIISHKDEPDLPEGTILSQTPAAGTPIKENQALYLVIAQKPAPVKVPNVHNKSIADAAKLIENLSLHCKAYTIASDAPHNHCIAQLPQPGSSAADNTVIIYTANAYAKPFIMPDLKKKSVSEVLSFLNLYNINPTMLHQMLIDPGHQCINCTIIDQRPLPGTLVTFSPDKPLSVQLQVG